MELQSGVPLVIQQYKALLVKNFILARRNWRPAIIQLFSSLIFLFLIFCIDKAIAARAAASARGGAAPIFSPAIPPCEAKFFAKKPCFDFVWSGSSSPRIAAIVQSIMRNNPGRPIPTDRVMAFKTPDDVDVWLAQNPLRCPGALHFVDRNSTVISYGIQTNSTQVQRRGTTENPTFKFQIPLQIAAEREISRFFLGDPSFSWDVGFKEYPHPDIAPIASAMGIAGPTFFLSMAMFGFVFQISSLVTEKELKLRQAMTMMGLYETAYWLSWLTWETFLTFLSALLTVIFGMMFGFDFFRHNNFTILFLTFFLFQFNMIGFAFMISAFVRKSSSATTIGFAVFIAGFGTQIGTLVGFPSADAPLRYRLWFLFPPNLLAKALKLLSDGTATSDDRGISWRNRGKCAADDDPCVMTIEGAFIWLIATFFLWFILAIYLDNIIPNANGVRKPVLYFLNPFYWTGKGGNKVEEGSLCSCVGSIPSFDEVTPDDEDVLAEETAVKQQATQSELDQNIAVQIRGLKKTYPGTTSIGCCKCKRSKPFHAVKGLWVNFAKDQLFCLLGPNGAGKTTTISCLTGITPVTGGDALIYGYSVRSSVGMSNIRRIIGVCPQFDVLWDALTAQEHLLLFSSIKGLHPPVIQSVVDKSLNEVKLTGSARVRAGSYSGGMKRRLSVAVALIGDPKMVFLDEPTTGMDPINRRHVWDIIEDAKKGRAIVLTTHSMEEADILGDRIAIMAKGRLRCIGNSIRLKSRFGSGYITNVSFLVNTSGDPPVEPVKQFFKSHLDVEPKEETKTLLTFVIPREKEGLLTNFFAELQDREGEFGISDIQLGLTTLEEVFLNIAQQAELENSASEESFVTLSLSSGASIQILKGARYVGIPGTETPENPRGLMVEVYWVQDESGNLCISSHSDEVPVPLGVQLDVFPPRNTVLGGGSPMVGIPIDSGQVQGGQ